MKHIHPRIEGSSDQESALQALEDAFERAARPCMNPLRRAEDYRAVWRAYQRCVQLRLQEVLTPTQLSQIETAARALGEEL